VGKPTVGSNPTPSAKTFFRVDCAIESVQSMLAAAASHFGGGEIRKSDA
jgi:hypothetical protein